MPRSCRRSSTLRSESGKRTYSITAKRMISGLVLKYLNGECFVIRRGYETTLPVSTSFCLTVPIVLVEEIDLTRKADPDMPLEDAIVTASTSRLRPVFLAAATTILGMLPLLWDAFFQSMAATIMGGLAFASLLTMVAAPVLYYVFFKRSKGPVDNSAKMVA